MERCFSLGYIAKVKNKMIEDLEEKLESSQYDPKIREDLAYYAKGRWRAKFLFESESAMKIQNCFKVAKARWKWQLPLPVAHDYREHFRAGAHDSADLWP